MKKTIEIEVNLSGKDVASIFEDYDCDMFADMLNNFGGLMKRWGEGNAEYQFDRVGISAILNENGRFAASMIARASEPETEGNE